MAAVEEFHATARGVSAAQHRAEAWRALLLERGDTALTALMKERELPDVQSFRQLVRKARQETAAGKPPAAARALFRALRELDAEEPLPPAQQS
jgi:ribosome-associated protein